jgi:hypothetical protein
MPTAAGLARAKAATVSLAIALTLTMLFLTTVYWPTRSASQAPLPAADHSGSAQAGQQLIEKAIRDQRHRQLLETLEQRGRAATKEAR